MKSLFQRNGSKLLGLAAALLLLAAAFMASIAFGTTPIQPATTLEALLHYDPADNEHVIILTTRAPRAAYALAVGASLAVAGALMQALTRNPLASPGLFGINAGAVLAVVLALTLLPLTALSQLVWAAFAGAAVAALLVYWLASLAGGGMTPIRLVLAGSALSALFGALTQGVLALDESGLQNVLFWLAGSVAGKEMPMLQQVLPYMVVGGIVALALSYPLTILASGDDVAKGLGQRTGIVKTLTAASVVLLAGSAVAAAGAIGFVGLVMPHIARYLIGTDYRWVIPYSAVLGAILLLLADVAARFPVQPGELPLGVVTGLIGMPFFIYIARAGLNTKEAAG
ncbi:iron ABC transporter permease [Paenibacillus sp. JCM 10914]|uniref:FecCD family ABC transporter permease n=1 Tax=Paenibacillus sp. JCM 10914 TaxID=1236974 RepID=UPI0003CC5CF8|nr:iron ABC transporter permease [Paenibacillus sp. JCM 10914]GAE06475.1 ABC-type Fe3+-siderophore transport system, permease component [Paenibacillus sp. JCM 10914]